ncbi:MAG: hypothetical protein R3C49_22845 [Planctomycetaceae bacterium]
MLRFPAAHVFAAVAVLLSGVPTMAQTATAAKVISDQILPKDTYLYVSAPDVSAMKDFVTSSSLGQLWNDPALQDFKAEVDAAIHDDLQEGMLKFQEKVGISLLEVLNIPAGEVTVAFCAGPANTMGVALFLDYGDSELQVQELLGKATEALNSQPKLLHQTESVDGTEVTLYEIQYPGRAPTPLAKEFGWFVKDQRLVFSNRMEILEDILANWDGERTDSFQQNEAYGYLMTKCQSSARSSLTTAYFDPIGLFTKLVQTGSLGQGGAGAGMALPFLPALGLSQLKGIGYVSEAGSGDFEAVGRSVIYLEQPAMGLMKAMQFDHCRKNPPEWVKENVNAYVAAKWKIDEAFTSIESLVDMFSGAGALAAQLDKIADQGPGIHLKHDVVDQLTGDLQIITAPGETGEYGGDQILVSLGTRNDDSMSDILAKIANQANFERREFRGAEVFETSGPAPGQAISFCVSEGRLLICVGTTLMETVLRNDSDVRPLAESDDFRKVSGHFPANAVSVQFTRPAETYRSIYEMLRSGEAAENFPASQDLFEKIDFTKLPPFETISKYIKPTGGYTVNDEHGLFMEAFQLKN